MVDALGILIFAVEGTLLALGILTVALRVYVRTRIVANFSYDDVFMVIALLINITDTGFTFHGIAIGSGKTLKEFIPVSTVALKSIFFGELLYPPVVMFAKLLIGFFLLRLVRAKMQRYIIYFALLVNALFSIAYFFLVLFQCFPVSIYWHVAEQEGKCMPKGIFTTTSYCHSVIVASADLLFVALPVILVWNLQMNLAMKFSVAGLLSTGALAGVSTLIRIPYVKALGDDNPATFLSSAITLVLLTCIESGIAIVLGNLAALRPLFIKLLGTKDEIKQVAASRRELLGKKVYSPGGKWQISEFGSSMQRSFAGQTVRDICEGESEEKLNKFEPRSMV